VKDILGPLFFVLMVGVIGFGLYMDSNRRKVTQAEAAPPAPPTFTSVDGPMFSAYRGIRVDIITDTATKREYLVVSSTDGVAITPRLPAEKP
jgi:hypothetical protein